MSVLCVGDASKTEDETWNGQLVGVLVLFGVLLFLTAFTGSVTTIFQAEVRLAREGKHRTHHSQRTVICRWDESVREAFAHRGTTSREAKALVCGTTQGYFYPT
jgi:hypothetical protein